MWFDAAEWAENRIERAESFAGRASRDARRQAIVRLLTVRARARCRECLKCERDAARGARAIGLLRIRKHAPLGFPAATRPPTHHRSLQYSDTYTPRCQFRPERAGGCRRACLGVRTHVRVLRCNAVRVLFLQPPRVSILVRALTLGLRREAAAPRIQDSGSTLPGWPSPDTHTHAPSSVRARAECHRARCLRPVPLRYRRGSSTAAATPLLRTTENGGTGPRPTRYMPAYAPSCQCHDDRSGVARATANSNGGRRRRRRKWRAAHWLLVAATRTSCSAKPERK